jgi:hypothetical protein
MINVELTTQIYWLQPFLETPVCVKRHPPLMDSEISLQRSQEPKICSYPKQ